MKICNFEQTKNNLGRFVRALAKRAFVSFLFLLFIALMLGGFLFYKFSILAEGTEPRVIEEPIQFKEEVYQAILTEWQVREERFEGAESKHYLNPFDAERELTEEKKLSEERTEELLSNPLIQELLKATNLYEFYSTKQETFLTIEERAQIWQELGLGEEGEYEGTYSQNIKFLSELKEELTK